MCRSAPSRVGQGPARGGARMSADTDVAGTPEQPPKPDWTFYTRMKAQGRLNLLLRLTEPLTIYHTEPTEPRTNVVPFVSRVEHLLWRSVWKRGRFVRLSWPPEERAAILRQDEIFRRADAAWELRHPAPTGLATVIPFFTAARGTGAEQ